VTAVALTLDVELGPEEIERVASTDPRWWFTEVHFANARSPRHPAAARLEGNNEFKRGLVLDWVERLAPRARVLDTFCANGAFSFECARLGAASVLGVDFDPPRIECGELVAGLLRAHDWPVVPEFRTGDVYELPAVVGATFDLVLSLGGLYHVADPVLVLRRLREVTADGGHLVLQTSRVVSAPGRWSRFMVRGQDRRGQGLSSHKRGEGVWQLSPGAIEAMLGVAGFRVVETRRPSLRKRRRFPWFAALAEAA
jgi:2-polyprenyl-3-methyl-5-hydroxy-6-metoxy-1,4-benzoquinol methylase